MTRMILLLSSIEICSEVGAIVVGCAVAVAIGFGVDAAKDAWLERRR